MSDHSRIEGLRRRVQDDPASIAFAQLAEECRRAGDLEEAVRVCQQGLRIHTGYLSARVTLARALLELDQLNEAQAELETVLQSAPENLAAIRSLAEVHMRRGEPTLALTRYRTALALARNDPILERQVDQLERAVEPATTSSEPPAPRAPAGQRTAVPEALPHPAAVRPTTAATTPAPMPQFEVPLAPVGAPIEIPPTTEQRTIAALEDLLDAIHVARTR